jgi:hypothetical protein
VTDYGLIPPSARVKASAKKRKNIETLQLQDEFVLED